MTGPSAAGDEYTWVYGYDGLKRLESANFYAGIHLGDDVSGFAPTIHYAYTYDRRGNRLTKTVGDASYSYTYNAVDQLISEQTPSGAKSYGWDAKGRLITETGPSATDERAYAWSADDRLLSVDFPNDPDRSAISYGYDHQGTLVGREEGTAVDAETKYLADYRNLTGYSQTLAEESSTNGYRNYIYGQDHLALSQIDGTNGPQFLHGDHLGTTRLLTNSAGTASNIQNYEPF